MADCSTDFKWISTSRSFFAKNGRVKSGAMESPAVLPLSWHFAHSYFSNTSLPCFANLLKSTAADLLASVHAINKTMVEMTIRATTDFFKIMACHLAIGLMD